MASIATVAGVPLAAVLVIAGCAGDDDVDFGPGCITSADCAQGESCDPVAGTCLVSEPPQPIEPAPSDPDDETPEQPRADAGSTPGTGTPPRCPDPPTADDGGSSAADDSADDDRDGADDDCDGKHKGKKKDEKKDEKKDKKKGDDGKHDDD